MLRVGKVAPETYSVAFTPGTSGLDLTGVSAVTLKIRKPSGSTATWSTALTNQTTSTLTATHTFSAAPSEVDEAGTWHFLALFTVAGGYIQWDDWTEDVVREHGS